MEQYRRSLTGLGKVCAQLARRAIADLTVLPTLRRRDRRSSRTNCPIGLVVAFSAGAAIAAGSSVAASAVLRVTDVGTIVGGFDGLGLFGTAGASLSGDSYRAEFTFDLSARLAGYSDGSEAYAYGGRVFGGSPFVSEVVTINGVSAPAFGDSAGEINSINKNGRSAQSHFAASVIPVFTYPTFNLTSYTSDDYVFAPNSSIPLNYSQYPSTYTSADYAMSGYFNAFSTSFNLQTLQSSGNWTAANAALSSVTVNDPGGLTVPEPATWAMMMFGFGGVAFAGFRAKRPASGTAIV